MNVTNVSLVKSALNKGFGDYYKNVKSVINFTLLYCNVTIVMLH